MGDCLGLESDDKLELDRAGLPRVFLSPPEDLGVVGVFSDLGKAEGLEGVVPAVDGLLEPSGKVGSLRP